MAVVRQRKLPRQRQPELEHDYARPTSLGYEAPEVATSGKAFVGDWIGPFQPGHLVPCGPRLPHNWISLHLPEGGVANFNRRFLEIKCMTPTEFRRQSDRRFGGA